MAELLGAVASGIAVTQVAGEIVGTCLKIKRLMNELDEMPARLESLLSQVELLAPIISETSVDNSTFPLRASLNGALSNSISHCQMALDELKALAESLSSQIEASRGVRRKIKLVKAMLKKDQLKQCERSLQTAVQLLSLAQQTYIFALQRVQPDIITLQVLRHLEARGNILSLERGQDVTALTPRNEAKPRRKRKMRECDSFLRRGLRLGLPCITGAVEIYRPLRELDTEETLNEKGEAALLQFRFCMPTWLCSMVIDSTI
ncbi:hypothetical protein F4803DRAFT_539652 [Xylaria telfairii]|nr:hypothetical protein F4803DRAFT_539652 [Xylaria telfairii]